MFYGDERMNKYGWNITLPESVLKTQEILNGLVTPALVISEAWKNAIPHYDFSGVQAAMNAYVKNLEIISTQVSQMSSVAKSVLPLIDTSVYASLVDTAAIKAALTSVDWSWLSEVYSTDDDENIDDPAMLEEKELDPEIRAEMAADITEVLAEPESMHITSRNKYIEWVKKSPENAIQFLALLFAFIQTICMMVQTWQGRPVKDSQVYQEPVSTSNVVYNLTVENNITVVGDAPYYYEVEFVNPETGEPVTGYVYKANITAADTEGSENTEVTEPTSEATEPTSEETEPTTEATELKTELTE